MQTGQRAVRRRHRHGGIRRRQTRRQGRHRRPVARGAGRKSRRSCKQSSQEGQDCRQPMNLSEPFILRPVMTTLVMAALVIFGAFGYSTLPVSELPSVDFPTIVVSASLPGADPETMASAVATPIEGQLSTIAGIDSMTSSSTLGSTQITIQFELDRDIDARVAGRAAGDLGGVAQVAAADDDAADLAQGEPGGHPDHLPRDEFAPPCRCRRSTNTPKRCSPGNCRRWTAWRRSTCSARRNTRCACRSIPPRWRRGRSALISSPPRSMPPTSTWRRELSTGRRAPTVIDVNGQLNERRAINRAGHRLSQRRAGPAERRSQRHRQRREHPDRKLVQRPARHRARRCSASPAPTRSRS